MNMKRKLDWLDSPLNQFQTLRQVRGLSQAECREIAQLLREDDKGKRTATREVNKFPWAASLLKTLHHPDYAELRVYSNDLCDLIRRKMETCPLFALLFTQAVKKHAGKLTLIFFADEAQPGNVLGARQARKANLVYVSFLELQVLHKETLWLPICVILAKEINAMKCTYSDYTRLLLEDIRSSTADGFPVELIDKEAWMVFIDRLLVLGDHEGLRSLSGCKGAAGAKPCCKCSNVVANGREVPEKHVGIYELEVAKFARQTTASLAEILDHLQACLTKKERQSAEVALGWKTDTLQRSMLASPNLRGWATLESICLDSMHAFHSNGHIGQELGLWYHGLLEAGYALETLVQYIELGWKSVDRGSIAQAFDTKLFKINEDYRGDAQECSMALSICIAFASEVLCDCKFMEKQNASLRALGEVVEVLAKCKLSVCFSEILELKQKKHGAAFLQAYGSSVVRPKFHYAKHLVSQMLQWNRHIDGFVCERKHRLFKTVVGPKLNKLSTFSKSAVLQLTECDLGETASVESYLGCLCGKAIQNAELAKSLQLPEETLFASGAEYHCVSYLRNHFFQFSRDVCVQLHGACKLEKQILLLVEQLVPSKDGTDRITAWLRTSTPWKLCHVQSFAQCEAMRLFREREGKIYLLR